MFRKVVFFRVRKPVFENKDQKRLNKNKAKVEGSDMTFDLKESSARLCGLVHGQMFRGEFINNY